jgi:hypothetical protein
VTICLIAWGCSATNPQATAPRPSNAPPPGATAKGVDNPLYRAPASYDFSRNPRLLARILDSPHGYFRFVNPPFAKAVCARFREDAYRLPTVNLHGDAHLEQYAVTERGRGLTDFDAASTGPGILDLVRFGVSLHLACRANSWNQEDEAFGEFLRGYRAALEQPEIEAPEPGMVARIRSSFARDRGTKLEEIERFMEPLEVTHLYLETQIARYAEMVRLEHPELAESFFEIKSAGSLKLGIGSALDEKHLVRVEGATESDEDDVILEAKQVRNLTGVDCIQSTRQGDPMRILTGESRIAYQPYRFLGYIVLGPDEYSPEHRSFWVHAWEVHYHEVKIASSLETPASLLEIAYDVGVQLGRGHPKDIAFPHDAKLRREQLEIVGELDSKLKVTVRELTDQIVSAWQRFQAEAGPDPAVRPRNP